MSTLDTAIATLQTDAAAVNTALSGAVTQAQKDLLTVKTEMADIQTQVAVLVQMAPLPQLQNLGQILATIEANIEAANTGYTSALGVVQSMTPNP